MADVATTRQLVVFSISNEEYAVPITRVQEIIDYTEPRSVVADAAWIRGVISLRGKIVPVYDLGARLGLAADGSDDAKIVIVEVAGEMAGVIVDDVTEVLTVEDEQLEDVPADTEFIDVIAKIDDRLVILLDPEGIFADAEVGAAA